MLPAGTTIGSYRVLGQIGEGGMGTVYLGEHVLLGRRAAIKVLLPQLSVNAEIVKRFFNEARAVTQIADPGIVQVFDFGHHSDGSAFIVMELLDGEPMDKRLARVGRMGLVETLRLMRLVCASLSVAHDKGIVHRDLKPENIFIVPDPAVTGGERPKILDFGIAKLSSDDPGSMKTRTGLVMGTPVYMSPEQCRGAAEVDHRSDIYALGCVMLTMLTGRPPFEGQGSGDLIAMHLREPAPFATSRVPHLPPVVDEILQRCLCKSPADRYPSMTALVQVLETIEERASAPGRMVYSQPTIAAPSAATAPTTISGANGQTRAPQPAARGRWLAGVAVVIAAAIAVIAVVVPRGDSKAADAPAMTAMPRDAVVAIDAAVDAPPSIDASADAAVPIDAPRRSLDKHRTTPTPKNPEPYDQKHDRGD